MRIRKRTASVLAALLSILIIASTAAFTDASAPARISRQPSTFAQRQCLVNPYDKAVQEKLHEILGGSTYDAADMPRTVADFSALENWTKDFRYVSDEEAHGISDYWQTPSETIGLNSGDCEDIAILFVSLLRAYGVPADEAYVAVGVRDVGNWHAFVCEKCFMRSWRVLDPEGSTSPFLLSAGLSPYEIAYCFNDLRSIANSPPVLPDGQVGMCEISTYPWGPPASSVFRRELAAGEKVIAAAEWLVNSPSASSWEEVVFPWSLSLYDESGAQVATRSGTDASQTLEYSAEKPGTYYLEIVKQDNDSRYFWLDGGNEWIPESPGTVVSDLASPRYDVRELTQYQSDSLVRKIKNPPPPEMLAYVLELINRKRAPYAGNPGVTAPVPTATITLPPSLPLTLGNNPSAQAHSEDMLARRYYAFWDSNGLTPALNHGVYGGSTWGDAGMYYCTVNWSGAKDELYFNYLKSLLATAVDALARGGRESPEGYDLLHANFTSVSIGLSWDDEYLFLVLDYEYPPVMVCDEPPTLEDGVVTLSGQQTAMTSQGLLAEIHYFRAPQTLTPTQLNATGRDYPALSSGGQYVSLMGKYLLQNLGAFIADQAPIVDPADFPASGTDPGLESRGPLLAAKPYVYKKVSHYNAKAPAWDASGGRYFIRLDLSKIIGTLGPGIYTVSVSSYRVEPDHSTRSCRTRFSFFVK
jgi:predicted transglutaminase-like cysteine proteinase